MLFMLFKIIVAVIIAQIIIKIPRYLRERKFYARSQESHEICSVELVDVNGKLVQAVRILKTHLPITLPQAKMLVERPLPVLVAEDIALNIAQAIQSEGQKLGIIFELHNIRARLQA